MEVDNSEGKTRLDEKMHPGFIKTTPKTPMRNNLRNIYQKEHFEYISSQINKIRKLVVNWR